MNLFHSLENKFIRWISTSSIKCFLLDQRGHERWPIACRQSFIWLVQGFKINQLQWKELGDFQYKPRFSASSEIPEDMATWRGHIQCSSHIQCSAKWWFQWVFSTVQPLTPPSCLYCQRWLCWYPGCCKHSSLWFLLITLTTDLCCASNMPMPTPSHVLVHSNFTRWALLSSPFHRWRSKQRRDKQLAPGLILRSGRVHLNLRLTPELCLHYQGPLASVTHTHILLFWIAFAFSCKCILCFPKLQWTQWYAVLCLVAQS